MLTIMLIKQRSAAKSTRRTPRTWQTLMAIDRGLIELSGDLRVTGSVPGRLRGRAVLLAPNHIGNFDPFVLTAACHAANLAPVFMLTGGILDAPVIGPPMRASGHVRVDRRKRSIKEAFDLAIERLRTEQAPIICYPEGRIGHDPGLWPERGKTGVARIALATGVPVIPVSQWGAHESMYWGCDVVHGPADLLPIARSYVSSLVRRPRLQVHFGEPVCLDGLSADRPGDARRAHERIMRAIVDGLVPLRRDEPQVPRFVDPTRPTDTTSPWRPG